jgi:hypothetical protein
LTSQLWIFFFQYYICKFPLFSTKYMININFWNIEWTFFEILRKFRFFFIFCEILGNFLKVLKFYEDLKFSKFYHPFIISLKMILITWLRHVTIHNTEPDFLMSKYMISLIWYGSFRITSRINPRHQYHSKISIFFYILWNLRKFFESFKILWRFEIFEIFWNFRS